MEVGRKKINMVWTYFPNGYILSSLCEDREQGKYEACVLKYYEYQPKTILEKLKRFFRIQTRFIGSRFCRHEDITNLPVKAEYEDKESLVCFRYLNKKELTKLKRFVATRKPSKNQTVFIQGSSSRDRDNVKITWRDKT